MKDLTTLKQAINKQLATVHQYQSNRIATLKAIQGECKILRGVKEKWLEGIIPQSVYQSFKAHSTQERNDLHHAIVNCNILVHRSKARLRELQREHALGLKAQQERQKDNLFLEGKAIYDSLTGTEQNALDHYFLSKSYVRKD